MRGSSTARGYWKRWRGKIRTDRPSPLPESLLETRVRSLLGLDSGRPFSPKELKALAGKVKTLADYFTTRQTERPGRYLSDKGLMAAYIAYYLPPNLLKIRRPLLELALHPKISPAYDEKLRLLDLGCGPGTASLGFLSCMAGIPPFSHIKGLEITAVDHAAENLSEASHLIESFAKTLPGDKKTPVSVNTVRADMTAFAEEGEGQYDFIVISNALVELPLGNNLEEEGAALLEWLADRFLVPGGSLIVIEPALRETARRLHGIRDRLAERKTLNLYSPCITCGPCGALNNPKDWCHEADGWTPTTLVSEIDALTGFDKSRLNYAYLVLRRDNATLSDVTGCGNDRFRMVSDLRSMKGERRIFLCSVVGRIEAGRLDRERSDSNAPFDGLKRGDLVRIEGLEKKGAIYRIGREAAVTVLTDL